jgi:zinc transport system ATP-binding protein
MSATLVRAEALVVGRSGRALLPPIDFAIGAGEVIAVVGRNGAGKTTFALTLLGLVPPLSGRVVRGRPGLRMAYVPQVSGLDDALPIRAREWVAFGMLRGHAFLGPWLRARERAIVDAALEAAGAAALANVPLRDLSEGQKQRVVLARLMASDPELAVLDEPTAAMDAPAQQLAFAELTGLAAERGAAIVVVTHALSTASLHADRILVLDRERGAVVAGTRAEVTAHPAFRALLGEAHDAHGAAPRQHTTVGDRG